MVAVIKAGRSLRRALHYNENKVKQQVARLIQAAGYAKDPDQLGFTEKIRRLEKLTELNERTRVNSLHISLNFDPSEKLSDATMRQVADRYMQKIGFGQQPYLVYVHEDAGHPHLHIVTTNIQATGKRIELHNIGRLQSEKARRAVEKEFNLVRADDRQRQQVYTLQPVKVRYGRSATKRAITNVLDAVLSKYKYTSLPELNAVLRQYNVLADQGSKESRVYKHGGLLYRVLNEKGEKVGVPIPASDFHNKPTLKFLQQRFLQNEPLRERHQRRVKNAIDAAITQSNTRNLQDLATALQQQGINLVVRQNAAGLVYGLTYVDHTTQCVFNGSHLGKAYSANQVQQRLQPTGSITSPAPSLSLPRTTATLPSLKPLAEPLTHSLQELLQSDADPALNPELQDAHTKKRKRLRH